MGVNIPKENGQFKGSQTRACPDMPAFRLQRSLDLVTEIGTFGKGSGTWESATRLVLSQEDYFRFGFGATMQPFVRLL